MHAHQFMECSSTEEFLIYPLEECPTEQCTSSNIIFLGAYHCSCISPTKRQSKDNLLVSIRRISLLADLYFYIITFVAIHSSNWLIIICCFIKRSFFYFMLNMTMMKLLQEINFTDRRRACGCYNDEWSSRISHGVLTS